MGADPDREDCCARGSEHSPTVVQFNQPARCAVIGRETLIGGEHIPLGVRAKLCGGIWSRIAEVTEQARAHSVAEVEDKRVPRSKRVGEELARGHLVLDVVRAHAAGAGNVTRTCPSGLPNGDHVHEGQQIVASLSNVSRPGKRLGAPLDSLVVANGKQPDAARKAGRSMAVRCPNSIGSGVERTGGCGDRFRPHKAESSGTPKTIRRSVTARQ